MAHNNRVNVYGNPDIDQSRLNENVYFVQKDIRTVYKDIFGDAVESYNAKQSRKDRKIGDYYDKIRNDSKTHEQRELIVAIGEGKDGEEYRSAKKAALVQYAEEFQERNPNLAVYNMVLHDDEANPHLHINYVPNFESKRGLTRRVGMDKALQQQGVEGNGMKLIKYWRENETARIEELAKSFIPEFERANVGSHKYMKVPQFKEAKESLHVLEKEGLQKREEIEEMDARLNDLHSSKDILQGEYEAQKSIVREFKERGRGLSRELEEVANQPQYKAERRNPIYRPKTSEGLSFTGGITGRIIKIKSDDYKKMVSSQKKASERYEKLANRFDVLAEKLREGHAINHNLAVELDKAREAIPAQTEDFVLRSEYEKLKKDLKRSEDLHLEKDKIIRQQREQIGSLVQELKNFKTMCVDFIKVNIPKAYDLVNSFAKKLNLVKDVNQSMEKDRELEQRQKRRNRDMEIGL